jgi:lipopolysaccharide export system permease protein
MMRILDRYIARQFLFNFLMLFVVISGLYVLLDLIVNFDEFAAATRRVDEGGVVQRATGPVSRTWSFYWPRIFLLYVYVAGLLPIGAAGFTLAGFVRNRELVAMMAGGVSLRRVAVPIVALTIAANVALLVDQELLLPKLAAQLAQGHAQLKSSRGGKFKLKFAPDGHGRLFTCAAYDPATQTMNGVTILVRYEVRPQIYDRATERVLAAQAVWDEQRRGWELINAHLIREPVEGPASADYGRSIEPVEFISSDLDPHTILLRERERYRQLLSTRQLASLLDKAQVVDTQELKRIYHSRFSLLVVNVLILLMGLPVLLLRTPGPLLLPVLRAAAVCIPAWAGGFIMHQLSPAALPPAAVAWLPVALYLPVAFYMFESIET